MNEEKTQRKTENSQLGEYGRFTMPKYKTNQTKKVK